MSEYVEEQSEITLPKWNPLINNKGKIKNVLKFTMSNTNKSIANGLRRTMLSDVPSIIITDINISKNTTQFNNQIIEQRLSCVPVHIDTEKDVGELEMVLDMENNSDRLVNITTEDIRIRNAGLDKWSSPEEQHKIFPPNPYTKDFILLSRLKTKISSEIPGESLKLTAKFGIGTPKDNGSYNVVSTSSYGFTPDKILNHSKKQDYETSLKEKDLDQKDIDNHLENWDNHNYKRNYIEGSFDFSVESVGSILESEIVKKACNIINVGLQNIIDNKEPNTWVFKKDEIALANSYDIVIQNIDYTLGKIIEYVIFEEYFKNQNILSFSGFIKPHPHDEHSIIRIAFKKTKDNTEENVESILVGACKIGQRIYSSIYSDFNN
jgi:DNA-directed RNA polymerase subunit L